MPNYDYKCLQCNETFEIFQSIKEAPLTQCPNCNGQLKRLIGSGAGIIFTGSGFYQTDYKNKSNGNSKESKKTETKQEKISA
ncbi:MAG: zinc ribbon domain-containing protein [Ignavibacterium sp.]|nr:zinc ribbon domain-containing protein [Ignavibacterium sp.]MCX7611125.1 zinc ribbon domain-containing protein [Ignavibacterium sp.]MDW8376010.1 FmdB family zinc ribbon protein [Ignavibacteriales bacterium]